MLLERLDQQRSVLAVANGPIDVLTVLADHGKSLEDHRQKPAKPYALAAALVADTVHTVVPVARSHQRETVRADDQASIDSSNTVLIE